VISNRIVLSMALIELEKFSLIKWNRINKIVSIHRLVQSVVKDEMSDSDSIVLHETIINLCYQSFPQAWNNENRTHCRDYVGQVMGVLLDQKVIQNENSANIMYRVGWFLRYDGRFIDSEKVSLKSVEIYTKSLGDDHFSTLNAADNLAGTYWALGRAGEAAALQEQVLEKSRRILGGEHPGTLSTMNNLALTYKDLGRAGEAAALHEQVLEKRSRCHGSGPDTGL